MYMTPYVLKVAQWLLTQAGGKLFNTVTDDLAVKMGVKPELLTVPKTRVLLEDYLQRLEDRLAQRVIARLDEDRLIKLKSGIVQLKRSSRTTVQRESLVYALSNFSDIISLPEQGETGGFPNAQLRSIAFLGIAAAHIALQDSKSVIAENIAAAVYADSSTADQWLGEDFVRNLLIHNPNFRSPSIAQQLPKVAPTPQSQTAKALPSTKSFPTAGRTLLTYRGHNTPVSMVAWSPDGRYIASAAGGRNYLAKDQTVQVWDTATRKEVVKYQGHSDDVIFF